MTRTEWKAFHHALRANARAFREQHGGYPCMSARLEHNGREWTMTRKLNDRVPPRHAGWITRLETSLLRQRPAMALHAAALDEAATYRDVARRQPWHAELPKRAAHTTLAEAAEIRAGGGWPRPRFTQDNADRFARAA